MDILIPMVHPINENVPYWGREEDKDYPLNWVDFCPKFPHLFRLLKWWEHVPVDELPKYVKWELDDSITEYFKVSEWLFIKNDEDDEDGRLFVTEEIDNHGDAFTWDFNYDYDGEIYPSTESEYNDYLTKLNGK